MFGMDERPVPTGDETPPPAAATAPAGPPEWSVPSPWTVAEVDAPVFGPPPPPPPPPGPEPAHGRAGPGPGGGHGHGRLGRSRPLDIDLSRPALTQAPEQRPRTDPARPGGRLNPRPWRQAPSGGAPDIDVNAVAAKVQPGVVDIYTQLSSGASGAGTGVILTPDGEVLTNNHVIEGSTSISIVHIATGQRYTAVVVGVVPTEDIAVLQIQGAFNLPTVPLGKSSTVEVGDPIVALGNAGGVGGAPHTVSGTVQALNQTITATDLDGSNAETLVRPHPDRRAARTGRLRRAR